MTFSLSEKHQFPGLCKDIVYTRTNIQLSPKEKLRHASVCIKLCMCTPLIYLHLEEVTFWKIHAFPKKPHVAGNLNKQRLFMPLVSFI